VARPSIELPCGCVVTETHVVAMCIEHVHALRAAAIKQRKEYDGHREQMRRMIEELK